MPHASNDLRDAFLDAIPAFEAWEPGEAEPTVDLRGEQRPISEICGLLWNCGDVLPRDARNSIDDLRPEGTQGLGTYAAGARLLRSLMVMD